MTTGRPALVQGLVDHPPLLHADVAIFLGESGVARAQGVGPKLAGRIVNELKDKAGALPAGTGPSGGAIPLPQGSATADAVSALQNLGFKPAVATTAVAHAMGELGEGAELNDLVRVALKRAAG